jgi:18S rRNA (adenine1779-N6/adenine1780-N6)-dimethyltransferase
MKLLGVARRVRAFDIDERMVGDVRRKALSMGYTNLDVFFGDALRSEFGSFDVCVANLPYNISSPFIFKLIAHRPVFRLAILMFQKEFADR